MTDRLRQVQNYELATDMIRAFFRTSLARRAYVFLFGRDFGTEGPARVETTIEQDNLVCDGSIPWCSKR
jgi:hypothetical protein